MAQIIDGKKIAGQIREDVRDEIARLKGKGGRPPGLAVVLAGNDPASSVYVRMKHRACEEAGIVSFQHMLDEDVTEDALRELVLSLNRNDSVDGILVQLPLPKQIDEQRVLYAIDPAKDVDGFHPENVGKMLIGDESAFYPCTPLGCQELINRYVSDCCGKHLVVIGRSNIVGKPLASMMVQKNECANCIVTICHTAAPDIGMYTREADIVVVAVGRPGTLTADMVREGVVVIDVGVNRIADPEGGKPRLVGDVDYEGVSQKAAAITPVPGGVGPMTIAMLMRNTLKAYRVHRGA